VKSLVFLIETNHLINAVPYGVEIATKRSATRHGSNRFLVVDVTMAPFSETMQSDVMELMS
jgi:hypothetical protein